MSVILVRTTFKASFSEFLLIRPHRTKSARTLKIGSTAPAIEEHSVP